MKRNWVKLDKVCLRPALLQRCRFRTACTAAAAFELLAPQLPLSNCLHRSCRFRTVCTAAAPALHLL
jgi:putative component of membrane protein insertase Oxa1/YidC/SpoIIIJ protein YidD